MSQNGTDRVIRIGLAIYVLIGLLYSCLHENGRLRQSWMDQARFQTRKLQEKAEAEGETCQTLRKPVLWGVENLRREEPALFSPAGKDTPVIDSRMMDAIRKAGWWKGADPVCPGGGVLFFASDTLPFIACSIHACPAKYHQLLEALEQAAMDIPEKATLLLSPSGQVAAEEVVFALNEEDRRFATEMVSSAAFQRALHISDLVDEAYGMLENCWRIGGQNPRILGLGFLLLWKAKLAFLEGDRENGREAIIRALHLGSWFGAGASFGDGMSPIGLELAWRTVQVMQEAFTRYGPSIFDEDLRKTIGKIGDPELGTRYYVMALMQGFEYRQQDFNGARRFKDAVFAIKPDVQDLESLLKDLEPHPLMAQVGFIPSTYRRARIFKGALQGFRKALGM